MAAMICPTRAGSRDLAVGPWVEATEISKGMNVFLTVLKSSNDIVPNSSKIQCNMPVDK